MVKYLDRINDTDFFPVPRYLLPCVADDFLRLMEEEAQKYINTPKIRRGEQTKKRAVQTIEIPSSRRKNKVETKTVLSSDKCSGTSPSL